tara:strand:- start:9757 stop:10104 length:348 start_codon:yes stop_codon:yes gene_type:complete
MKRNTLFALFVGLGLVVVTITSAGEWNEKPVLCADEKETLDVLKEKEQILLFTGQEYAKVRSEKGLHPIPAKIPLFFYANKKQGTYTIAEYHPTYKSYCVIAYGENLQDFSNGIQ